MSLKSIFLHVITSRPAYWLVKSRIKGNFLKLKDGFLDVTNQSTYIKCLAATRFYERREVELTKKHLRRDLDVIELGASIGFVSLAIAKLTSRKVISVEANPLLLQNLLSTKKKNNLDHLEFLNAAVSYSGDTEVMFTVDEKNLGSRIGSEGKTVRVPSVTLSELRKKFHLNQFALISDIEGAEIDFVVNENDQDVIQNCRQIIIELHDTTYKERFFPKEEIAAVIKEKFKMKIIEQDGSVWVFERK